MSVCQAVSMTVCQAVRMSGCQELRMLECQEVGKLGFKISLSSEMTEFRSYF